MGIKDFCVNRLCDVVVGAQGLAYRVQSIFEKDRPGRGVVADVEDEDGLLDLEKGLPVHRPSGVIEWDMTSDRLEDRFAEAGLKKLVFGSRAGDYVLPVTLQPGLECQLVLHFDPMGPRTLRSIDLVDGKRRVGESYGRFQSYLLLLLGEPLHVEQGDAGYQSYQWRVNRIQVLHHVVNQSGLKECVRFRLMKPDEFKLSRSA